MGGSVLAYLHDRGGEVGVNLGYWAGEVTSFRLAAGDHFAAYIYKRLHKALVRGASVVQGLRWRKNS